MWSQLCPNVNLLGSFRCSFTKLLRPSHCNVILGWRLSQKSSTSRQMSWSSLHDYTEPHATDCAVCVTSSVARSFCCVWCNTVGGNVNWHVFRNVSECFGHVCHLCAFGRSHSEWSGQRLPYLKAVADLLSSQHVFFLKMFQFTKCFQSQEAVHAMPMHFLPCKDTPTSHSDMFFLIETLFRSMNGNKLETWNACRGQQFDLPVKSNLISQPKVWQGQNFSKNGFMMIILVSLSMYS